MTFLMITRHQRVLGTTTPGNPFAYGGCQNDCVRDVERQMQKSNMGQVSISKRK
jgi:hypothetical protein